MTAPAPALPTITEDELARLRTYGADDEPGCGCLRTARGVLPLEAMQIDARIDGLLARTTVEQVFVNTLSQPLEATYIFPLPDRAAVSAFRFEVNGRVVEGVIRERGEARRTYDAAIAAGHRAAITEEERPGVFTMRVGNLMPGERATVRLELSGPLPFDGGEATYRFPLVVAPRYIPGSALDGGNVGDGTANDTDAVPDASRITPPVLLPGYPNPVRLGIRVALDAGALPLSKLRSSLHAVRVSHAASASAVSAVNGPYRDNAAPARGGVYTVQLAPGQRLDRDFILRFSVCGADDLDADSPLASDLSLCPDAAGESGDQGSFALTLAAPRDEARSPRDVIFVLDRSGSMGGWKMIAARRAVARMVDSLTDADRFGVMAFDNSIERPSGLACADSADLAPATDRNRFRAVEFLSKIEARGGTEMARPLISAADALAGGYEDRQRVLVLVTDGQVGNEDQILRELATRLRNVRVFTLGIDQAVNLAFLRRLAALGGGLAELVESEDRLDEVMDRVHRRIGAPVLSELSLELEGAELVRGSVAPSRLPDVFAGAPLVVYGRYRGAGSTGVRTRVRGRTRAGATYERVLEASTASSSASPQRAAITKVWARAHLRDLEDVYVTSGSDSAVAKRVIEVSLRFGVLCRFTAFVAVDRSERVNPGGEQHKVTQAVEQPVGWEGMAERAKSESRTFAHAPRKATLAQASAFGGGGAGRASGIGGLGAPGAAAGAGASAGDMLSEVLADDCDMDDGEMSAEMMLDAAAVFDAKLDAPAAPPPPMEAQPAPRRAAPPPAMRPSLAPPAPASRSRRAAPEAKAKAKAKNKGGRRSVVERIARGIGELLGGSREEAASAGLDLAPYRTRVRELLAMLARLAHDERRALAELVFELSALVEDMRSVGVPAAALRPLTELLDDARAAKVSLADARARLERFTHEGAGGGAAEPSRPTAAPRRDDFWK